MCKISIEIALFLVTGCLARIECLICVNGFAMYNFLQRPMNKDSRARRPDLRLYVRKQWTSFKIAPSEMIPALGFALPTSRCANMSFGVIFWVHFLASAFICYCVPTANETDSASPLQR